MKYLLDMDFVIIYKHGLDRSSEEKNIQTTIIVTNNKE